MIIELIAKLFWVREFYILIAEEKQAVMHKNSSKLLHISKLLSWPQVQ